MDNSCRPKDQDCTTSLLSQTPCQLSINNTEYILKTLRELYEDQRFFDIFLKVGNKEYGAHKLILSASSDVFQVMLMNTNWSESHKKEINLVEEPQCQKFFHLFLKYMYTGQLMITHTNVQPILSLADKYMVKSLSRLCLQYMYDHVSHAPSHNQLFSWLQYLQSSGHEQMASVCEEFIKLNFQDVSESADFSNLDLENMMLLLKKDDLVIHDEAALYNCVVKWLKLQKSKLEEENIKYELGNEDLEMKKGLEIAEYMKYLAELVMQYIRFPMMKPREIANVLRCPLVRKYKDFLLDRLSMGAELHCGNRENITDAWLEENKELIQPRLYTSENCSAIIWIEDYTLLPKFHKISSQFQSDSTVFETRQLHKNGWEAFFYPKGVLYDPCYLLVWQGRFEVPEKAVSTVRMRICCTKLVKPGKFKFSILVFGVKEKVEHIIKVKSEIHDITDVGTSINIDEIVPFEVLNPPNNEKQNNPRDSFLIGMQSKTLKVQVIVMPVHPLNFTKVV